MYDFSLEPAKMNQMAEDIRKRIHEYGILVAFGHIGDENMHLQMACHKAEDKGRMEQTLEPYVFEYMKEVLLKSTQIFFC